MNSAQKALSRRPFRRSLTIRPGTDGVQAMRWVHDGDPVDLDGVTGHAQVRSHPGAGGPPALSLDVEVQPDPQELGWVRLGWSAAQTQGMNVLPPQDTTPVSLRGSWWWDCILVWPNDGPRLLLVGGPVTVQGVVTVVSG